MTGTVWGQETSPHQPIKERLCCEPIIHGGQSPLIQMLPLWVGGVGEVVFHGSYCKLRRAELLCKVQRLPEGCRQEERMKATVADGADSEEASDAGGPRPANTVFDMHNAEKEEKKKTIRLGKGDEKARRRR